MVLKVCPPHGSQVGVLKAISPQIGWVLLVTLALLLLVHLIS